MKGTPFSSWTVALAVTSAGMAGLLVTPSMKPVVRLAMRTAPTRAVPSEAPKLVKVFCRPPTSALCVVGHGRDGDRSQLGGECADAQADQGHGDEDDAGVGARIETGHQDQGAGQHEQHAEPDHQPRGGVREPAGGRAGRRAAA